MSNDDPDNCAHICKRNAATLLLCTMSSLKYHPIRVYHIDKLPEELFGDLTEDVSEALTETDDPE